VVSPNVITVLLLGLNSSWDGARNIPLGEAVQEIPLVASGEAGAEVSVQGPVASALDRLTGESCQFDVARPASNILNFNSISIPIDAQVNPKLKAKICVKLKVSVTQGQKFHWESLLGRH
jgi:hypothetical protein